MLETKTLTVNPNAEQSTIDLFACFAWNLKSSQEIKTKDSHLERRGDDIVSVTETEHYVKLVFERDTKRENYARIKELEETYHRIMAAEPTMRTVYTSMGITVLLFVFYIIPGVLYLMFKNKKKKEAKAEYEAAYSAWKIEEQKAIAALNEAAELV